MSDEPTLRPATDGDAEQLVALHRAAIRAAGSDPDDVPGNDDLWNVEREYHERGGTLVVLVAHGDGNSGEIVAMGGYKPHDERTVELFRMAVAPGRQGEGFGTRVIEALETRADDAGYERIRLETTARQAAAMSFYPHHGYAETGRKAVGEYTVVTFEKTL